MVFFGRNSMKEGEAHRQVRVTSPQILRGNALTQRVMRIYSVWSKIAVSILVHPDKTARSETVGAAHNAVTKRGGFNISSSLSNSLNSALDKIAYVISQFLFPHPTELKDGGVLLAVPLTSPQYSPQLKGSGKTSNFIAGLFACERVIIHSHSLCCLFCNSIVRDGGADTQTYLAPSLTMRVNALLGFVRGFPLTSFETGSWHDEVAA